MKLVGALVEACKRDDYDGYNQVSMNVFMYRLPSRIAACAAAVAWVLSAPVFSQTVRASVAAPATESSRTEVPDGSPQLAQEKVISNASTGTTGSANPGKSFTAVTLHEERIQGRLASANVSVGGAKGYSVVDPDAGRSDRQSSNGVKRLSPSTWELFRF